MKVLLTTNKLLKELKVQALFVLTIALFNGSLSAQNISKFKSGDRVCFIGNSITQDGRYHMLVHTYCATRFPYEYIEMYNCGISGDVAYGMLNRMDKDILSHNPNYAFLMTGMNDIQRYLYGKDVEEDSATLAKRSKIQKDYKLLTSKIADRLVQNKVNPIFMTPSIFDQTAEIPASNNLGANDALKQCAVSVRKLGERHNAPVVDLNPAMEKINAKMQSSDPSFTIVGNDRIHPGDEGHFVMAYNIIKTIMPSNIVSEIAINAKNGKLEKEVNCFVAVEKVKKELVFKVKSNALPFPITGNFANALELIPFQEECNQEVLTINELRKGKYELWIDDVTLGTFSAEDLNSGINLSNYSNTPQYKQAIQVFELCQKYHKVNGLLRNIGLVEYRMLNNYDGENTVEGRRLFLDKELEKQKGKSWYNYNVKTVKSYFQNLPKENQLWDELEEVRKQIFQINKPQQHTYKLMKM